MTGTWTGTGEHGRRRAFVPGWGGTTSRLRGVLSTAVDDRQKVAPQAVGEVEADAELRDKSGSAR